MSANQKTAYSGGTVTVSRTCRVTGQWYSVTVPLEQVTAWDSGALAQNAFPDLTPEQREFLISNTTPAEWEEMKATFNNYFCHLIS